MQSFAVFLFKSTLCSGLLYAYYMLALRGRKLNSYNRFYLLAATVVSLLLPALHFEWYTIEQASSQPGIKLLQAIASTGGDEVVNYSNATPVLTAELAATAAYSLVAILLALLAAYKIAGIYKLKRTGNIVPMTGYTLVYTSDSRAPFSFFKTIFWRDSVAPDSTSGQQIMQHELTHVKQHHTIDKLFMQLILCCCWVNPFLWVIRRELAQVHEFIADEAAIADNDTDAFARMLLQSHFGNIATYIVNPFFHSSIKRRIMMLNQTNKTKYATGRRLLILLLLPVLVVLFSFTVTKKEAAVKRLPGKTLLVLDAGHGGADIGGEANGSKEKDLNMAICNKIMALAANYNIQVVPTRRNDATLTLDERVQKANATKADLFLSIHANKASEENEVTNGYQVIVCDKNRRNAESRLLASAVVASMQMPGVAPVLVSKGLHVLRNSNSPAILIECGNMDNASDMAMLQDDTNLSVFCNNILKGVVAYQQAQHK